MKLELWVVEWGSGSETYDFHYQCLVNDRPIPGGRLTFGILKFLARANSDISERDFGHGYENRDNYSAALSALKTKRKVKPSKLMAEYPVINDDRQRYLWNALKTRALSNQELQEVARYGITINIFRDPEFDPEQTEADLRDALLKQLQFQAEKPSTQH